MPIGYNPSMDRQAIISAIRAAPDEVQAICRDLSDDQLRQRPIEDSGEAGWSLIELICHLRDSAEEDGTRIRRLVEEDNPTLVPFDQEEWARDRNYQGDDIRRALIAMRAMHTGLAYQLENLTEEDWARPGLHPEFGPRTVTTQAEQTAEHGQGHVEQMREVRKDLGL
jgi:hypothetical protein